MNSGDADDDAQVVECNVSKRKGVRFVTKPPDLRRIASRGPEECNRVQERAHSVVIESCALPACHI